jgi:hypothetical protein
MDMGPRIRDVFSVGESGMNWAAVSGVAEVLGLLVIVASLIYVAIQIRQNSSLLRQNSELARAAMVHETNASSTEMYALIAQSNELASIFERGKSNDSLNDIELARYLSLIQIRLAWLEDVDSQYKAGLYFDEDDDEDLIEYMAPDIREILSPDAVCDWWFKGAKYKYAPSFMEKIEKVMSEEWYVSGS